MISMHVPGMLLVPIGIVGKPPKTVPITYPPMGSFFCQMGTHTHPCRALGELIDGEKSSVGVSGLKDKIVRIFVME